MSTTSTVDQLRAAELKLEDDLTATGSELATARERAAEAVVAAALDGKAVKSTGDTPATISERITALAGAIETVRGKRIEAIRTARAVQADGLRLQAIELRKQADERAVRTNELLQELQAHEGCAFGPAVSARPEALSVNAMTVQAQPGMTITRSLRLQAEALDVQANTLAAQPVAVNGSAIVASRDELLTTIREWNALAISPALHLVASWLDEQEPAALARIARHSAEAQARAEWSYRLVWRAGVIVDAESDVTARIPAPVPQAARPFQIFNGGNVPEERKPQEFVIGGRGGKTVTSTYPWPEPTVKIG